jgi:hypothetical protein
MVLYDSVIAVMIAFTAGIGVSVFNRYVLNRNLICKCKDKILTSCGCVKTPNINEPEQENNIDIGVCENPEITNNIDTIPENPPEISPRNLRHRRTETIIYNSDL